MSVRAGATPAPSAGKTQARFPNGYRSKLEVGQVAGIVGGVPIARSAVSTVVKPIGSTIGFAVLGAIALLSRKSVRGSRTLKP